MSGPANLVSRRLGTIGYIVRGQRYAAVDAFRTAWSPITRVNVLPLTAALD